MSKLEIAFKIQCLSFMSSKILQVILR